MARTSCDFDTTSAGFIVCIILLRKFAHNCTETNVLYIFGFLENIAYILKPNQEVLKSDGTNITCTVYVEIMAM